MMKGCEVLILSLLTVSQLLTLCRSASHFCNQVDSAGTNALLEETVNRCCSGWTGELCSKAIDESQEGDNLDEEVVVKDNAVEIVVPVQRFTASQDNEFPKKDNSSLQIVFPICMLVLLAALLVVIIYAKKRYAALQRTSLQQLTEVLPVPSTSDGLTLDDHVGEPSELELMKKSDKPVQVDAPESRSYRSRMNDLNQGNYATATRGDVGSINKANVGLERESLVESQTLIEETTSDAVSLISNDQN